MLVNGVKGTTEPDNFCTLFNKDSCSVDGFDTATSIRKCLASYDTREIQSVTWFGRCSNTQLANFDLETIDLNNRLRGIKYSVCEVYSLGLRAEVYCMNAE